MTFWVGHGPDESAGEPAFADDGTSALSRVLDHLVGDCLDRFDAPHVLIIRSGYVTQYSGPFPDALSAACAAELELAANGSLPREERVEVSLAPLLTPMCAHEPAADDVP
jgi:hypothetical protein